MRAPLSNASPISELKCSTIASSDASKDTESRDASSLLISCKTPTILFLLLRTAAARILRVRYPVFLSAARENRLSKYASVTLRVSPVYATVPAIPSPTGTRITCASSPFPMKVHNSFLCSSKMNNAARSAPTKPHA